MRTLRVSRPQFSLRRALLDAMEETGSPEALCNVDLEAEQDRDGGRFRYCGENKKEHSRNEADNPVALVDECIAVMSGPIVPSHPSSVSHCRA